MEKEKSIKCAISYYRTTRKRLVKYSPPRLGFVPAIYSNPHPQNHDKTPILRYTMAAPRCIMLCQGHDVGMHLKVKKTGSKVGQGCGWVSDKTSNQISRRMSIQGAPYTHQSSSQCLLLMMIGRAGSHGPYISFLYFCNPISHQLHPPMATAEMMQPTTMPKSPLVQGHGAASQAAGVSQSTAPRIMPTPPPAPSTSRTVRMTW